MKLDTYFKSARRRMQRREDRRMRIDALASQLDQLYAADGIHPLDVMKAARNRYCFQFVVELFVVLGVVYALRVVTDQYAAPGAGWLITVAIVIGFIIRNVYKDEELHELRRAADQAVDMFGRRQTYELREAVGRRSEYEKDSLR